MHRVILIASIVIAWGTQCPCLHAQGESGPTDQTKQLQIVLEQRDRIIQDLLQRVAVLEKEVHALKLNETTGGSAGVVTSTAAPQSDSSRAVRSAPTENYDKEEQLASAALDRALISHGSLLLPPGTVELDNGFSYFNSSSDRLQIDGFTVYPVLIIGDIVSERSQREVLLSSMTARFGLPHAFQMDVRVPYGYQSERIVTADNKKTSQRFLGLGDVELGLTKELRRGRGRGLDLLGAFRWKSVSGPDPYDLTSPQPATLGTGFQSLQTSLTAAKSSDPLVFFGSLSYTANLSATKKIQTTDAAGNGQLTSERLSPGDTFGFQVGAALAVNPEASLSFALDQRFTRSTSLNGVSLPGTYLSEAIFNIGTSYIYAPGRSVDLGLGIGLSRGAPDFQFSVNFPMRFSPFNRSRAAREQSRLSGGKGL